jgi:hypothetical protein
VSVCWSWALSRKGNASLVLMMDWMNTDVMIILKMMIVDAIKKRKIIARSILVTRLLTCCMESIKMSSLLRIMSRI